MNIKQFYRLVFSPPGGGWRCSSCGRRVYSGREYCGFCGEEQDWEKCPGCNSILNVIDEKYCTHCGLKLK